MNRRSRMSGAMTLAEVMISLVIAGLIMGVLFQLFSGAYRMWVRGLDVAHGRQASMMFFERLEDELAACVVMPGVTCRPVAISEDGRRLAFFKIEPRESTLQVAVARPVEFALVREPRATLVRNGVPDERIALSDVSYSLIGGQDDHDTIVAWYLSVHAQFKEGGLFGRTVHVQRLIELAQPTSTIRMGASFTSEVADGSFLFHTGAPATMALLETEGLIPGIGPVKPGSPPPDSADATLASEGPTVVVTATGSPDSTADAGGEP